MVRQIVGPRPAALLRLSGRRRLRLAGGDLGLDAGDVRLQVVQAQGQLVGIEALGTAAIQRPLHLAQLEPQGFQLGQIGLLALDDRRQIAHQLLEQGGIGGQMIEVEAHGRFYPASGAGASQIRGFA